MNTETKLRILRSKLLSWQLWAEIRINRGELTIDDMPQVFGKKMKAVKGLKHVIKKGKN
ncbi:MAG TPA: hypothetical protein VFL70_11020 [Bacteroidia bacterium]|nr:hypothetical protein [Bacteroidia bacterium]